MSEIRKLAPVFEQTIARVAREIENLSVVVPVVPHTREAVRARVAAGRFSRFWWIGRAIK